METTREKRLSDLFMAALTVPDRDRAGLLAQLAPDDADLRDEVQRLLDADRRNDDGFLLGTAPLPTIDDAGPEDALAAAQTVGPFRLVSVLGRGEHAVVYLAEQEIPVRRRVALKVLRLAESSREVLRRFEQERRIIAQMDHPAVARLYQAGRTPDGRTYLAMEYVDGQQITGFAKARALSVSQRLQLFILACLGVEHAHQRGIIHRDLKPSNILAATGADGPIVKVIDFGIAKAMGSDHLAGRTMTRQGQIVGTPAYMSPEQIRGDADRIDTRSDVYALGAVLYELLTDQTAVSIGDAGPLTIVSRILDEEPRRPEAVNPALRGDPATIIGRALEKNAARRYQSVAELRGDIERFLDGRPIVARRPSVAYTARKFVARHRALVAVTLCSALVVSWLLWRDLRADREQYELALKVSQSWIGQARAMAKTVGKRERRGILIEPLVAQSSELLAYAPDHPGLLALHADVLSTVGDIEQERGQPDLAVPHFRNVLAIRERLAREKPGDADRQVALSIAHVRIGDVLRDLKDFDGGLQEYRAAMEIDERTVARHPTSAAARTALAWSCHRLGSVALDGDHALSLEFHTRELSIATSLAAEFPTPDNHRSVSAANMRLSILAQKRGDLAARQRHIRAALASAEAAENAGPDDRLAQMSLIWARLAYLDALESEFSPDRAYEYCKATLDRARELARTTPDDTPSLDALCRALEETAHAAEAAGDPAGAEKLRRELAEVIATRDGLTPRVGGKD